MTARPSDADRHSSSAPADTPAPGAADSFPATSLPRGELPSTAAHPGALAGVPAELVNHPTYEVQKELGRGGMGVVYLARNRVMNRLEVLKVLQDRLVGQPGLLQRFVNEVQMAARLQHPNIVIAYAAFPAGNALVLAMEHIDGLSLAELVARKGPLPVAHACAFARQAALGLQKAHEKGMVHRDIKPANLMVSREGVVKVLDFGLAKVASEEAETGLTGTGMSMGTPDYMAPEQALDAKSADIRADIYALGCTLFFLLAGKPPFVGKSPYEVMHAHQAQPAPPLAGVPAGLGELAARMLAKRPEDRPATPGEVAKALVPFCKAKKSERSTVPAPSLPPPPPPLPRRAVRSETTAPLPPPRRRRSGVLGPVLAGVAVTLSLVALLAGMWAGGVFSPQAGGKDDRASTGFVAGPLGASEKAKGDEKKAGPAPVVKEEKKEKPVKEKEKLSASFTNSIGMKLVRIPAGKFKMGSPAGEVGRDENDEPQHDVELTESFYLGTHEVTQKQFKDVMEYNSSYFSADGTKKAGANYDIDPAGGKDKVAGKDTADFPVENVGYEEAVAFCKKLTEKDRAAGKIGPDQEYRLPSEAQWEYSSRGGAVAYQTFHFGDKLSSKDANFDGTFPYGEVDDVDLVYLERTCTVGSYKPNGFGLYDMHGNVREWCRDWYDKDAYKTGQSPRVNPAGPQEGSNRVIRGGGWRVKGQDCRSAGRDWHPPAERIHFLGFRVSLVPSGKKE